MAPTLNTSFRDFIHATKPIEEAVKVQTTLKYPNNRYKANDPHYIKDLMLDNLYSKVTPYITVDYESNTHDNSATYFASLTVLPAHHIASVHDGRLLLDQQWTMEELEHALMTTYPERFI